MALEKERFCADLIVVNVVEDLVRIEHISREEAWKKVIESKTYQCLHDFETGMWKEGPDYFRDTLERYG